MLTFFLGTLVGAAFVLVVIVVLIVDPWAVSSSTTSFIDQYRPIEIPKELREFLKTGEDGQGISRWETCHSISLLLHMLFQEHKDGRQLRRWFHKRLQIELNDICTRSAAGRLIQEIRIRDLSLGTKSPCINAVRVENIEMSSDNAIFEKIILLIDMEYTGGFEASVDVTTVFGKKANLSIKLAKVAGLVRFILSRKPYNHWTFSFMSAPELAMDVSSQIQGHQLKRLVPLIKESIRRALQRKHVWPNYKIRYRPLFPNPFLQPSLPLSAFTHVKIGGGLEVTVLQGTRLETSLVGKDLSSYVVYCTVTLDNRPFLQNSTDVSHSLSVMLTYSRHDMTTPIGIVFEKTVVNANGIRPVRVAVVEEGSLADKAAFKPGDTLIAINNVPIRSERQVIRFLQQTIGDLLVLVDRNLDDIDDEIMKSSEVYVEPLDGQSTDAPTSVEDVSSARSAVVERNSTSPELDSRRRHNLSKIPSYPSIVDTNTDSITSIISQDALPCRPVVASVLRTESDRVPQVLISQASFELRRTRSESQLATKPLDTVSMHSTTSAGLDDEVVSVYTMSSLDSEPVNEKLLPSFEEISDCNDTLIPTLLTPRAKDSTLTPGITMADIERETLSSPARVQRPSVEGHTGESGSSFASSLSFRTEDDSDEYVLSHTRTASTRKQRLHATLRASKRRVLNLVQKRRVATTACYGETVELGADAIDLNSVANPDRESPVTPTGKRSPMEMHVIDKKEKTKKRKHRSPNPANTQSPPSLHDSPTASTGCVRSRTTKPVALQENVLWGQSLHYDLDWASSSSPSKTSYKYLNITVHAELSSTPVVGVTDLASPGIGQLTSASELEPSRPILLGYTSLYIPQILDDCQLTLSNYHREVFQLKPPVEVQPIIEASTSEFCRHAGYDPRLCYGDLTLGFRFFPEGFPNGTGVLGADESDEEVRVDDAFVITKLPALSPALVTPASQHVWKAWSGKGTTLCAMCRGKIWLKSASCCQRCLVVCHHKCVERAASGIACSPHSLIQGDGHFDELDVDVNCETGSKDEYPTCEVSTTSQITQPVLARGDEVELISRRVRLRSKMTEKLNSWRRGGKTAAKVDLDVDGSRSSHCSDSSGGAVLGKEELLSPVASIQDCLADVLPNLEGSPFIRNLYFRPGDAYNEQTISHAKLLGKEIFANLTGEERKAKINEQIDRIQLAIRETKDGRLAALIKDKSSEKRLESSTFIGLDERLQALAVVMLHYCAALQDCESQGRASPSAGSICDNEVVGTSAEGHSVSSACSSVNEINSQPNAPTLAEDLLTTHSTPEKLNPGLVVMNERLDPPIE